MTIYLLIAFTCLAILGILALLGLDDHHSALDHSHHGSTLLSIQGMLIFGVGFGSVGAVLKGYGVDTSLTVGGGMLFGVLLAFFGARLLTELKATESDSTPRMSGLVGHRGKTIGAILPPAYGEIITVYNGQSRTLRATADRPIPHNHLVRIDSVHGSDVHVTPL